MAWDPKKRRAEWRMNIKYLKIASGIDIDIWYLNEFLQDLIGKKEFFYNLEWKYEFWYFLIGQHALNFWYLLNFCISIISFPFKSA